MSTRSTTSKKKGRPRKNDDAPADVIAKRKYSRKYHATEHGAANLARWQKENAEYLREYRREYMRRYRQDPEVRKRMAANTRAWYRRQKLQNTEKYQELLISERERQRKLREKKRKERSAMTKKKKSNGKKKGKSRQ